MHTKSCRSAAATLALAAAVLAPPAPAAESPEEIVVTATRRETSVADVSRSVTVITGPQSEQQARLDRNLSSILAQTVPGMGPSTQAASNFGQSLRGRNFLVLIDGIPQSTPLRDGFRDLNTIEPSSLERIEVVRGGTAVYGFGAAGGIVNLITKKAADAPLAGYSQGGVRFSTEHFDDSQVWETTQRVSGTRGQLDYLLSGTYVSRNGRFDAEGDRIPPNPLGSQGGFSDSEEFDLMGKIGWRFDGGRQRIGASVNHLDNEQNSDFIFAAAPFSVATDPTPASLRTPAIRIADALPGSTNVIDPGTRNTVASLDWSHADLLGSSVAMQGYYGDLAATFPKFPGFNQGELVSEKFGTRLTIDSPLPLAWDEARVVWGLDYVNDSTRQDEFGPGASNSVPAMEQDAVAGFLELELRPLERLLLRAGVRHEAIWVNVDPVSPNRFGNHVTGGTLTSPVPATATTAKSLKIG